MPYPLKNIIYFYADDGAIVDEIDLWHTNINLIACPYEIVPITAAEILTGHLKGSLAFIMPGGADLKYVEKLNGRGNQKIRTYVEEGGVYIGPCAGGYYGSRYCDFHRGDRRGYEVLGSRELAFANVHAVGPVLAPYEYASESGARIAEICWEDGSQWQSYYNGGCYFDVKDPTNVRVLAHYQNEKAKDLPAIIECTVGLGKAYLSGIHPEYPLTSDHFSKGVYNQRFFSHFFRSIFPEISGATK